MLCSSRQFFRDGSQRLSISCCSKRPKRGDKGSSLPETSLWRRPQRVLPRRRRLAGSRPSSKLPAKSDTSVVEASDRCERTVFRYVLAEFGCAWRVRGGGGYNRNSFTALSHSRPPLTFLRDVTAEIFSIAVPVSCLCTNDGLRPSRRFPLLSRAILFNPLGVCAVARR
jgi:hypothetical protein